VPTYNPTVVYGAWPIPRVSALLLLPALLPALRARCGVLLVQRGRGRRRRDLGQLQLGGNDIDIDVNRLQQLQSATTSTTADRNTINNGAAATTASGSTTPTIARASAIATRRRQQKYNRGSSRESVQSREDFRGRADQGRDQMSREGLSQRDVNSGTRDLAEPAPELATSASGIYRDLGGTSANSRHVRSQRDLGSSSRDMGSSSRSSDAFKNVDRGSSTRAVQQPRLVEPRRIAWRWREASLKRRNQHMRALILAIGIAAAVVGCSRTVSQKDSPHRGGHASARHCRQGKRRARLTRGARCGRTGP
jgi:hypothetical protein